MSSFECPVSACIKELSKLQVMHFRANHNCDPVEWVETQHGSEIKTKYAAGKGCYAIADSYEWLSPGTVNAIVDTRNHSESVSGDTNPMKRDDVKKQFEGDDNPAKRPSVREKLREAATGHTLSEEAKQKISDKNTGNEISDEHRNAVSEAVSSMDRSYMQTKKYSQTLSESLKGREPTYPTPYEVSGLSHKVRSSWEAAIGRLLEEQGIQYNYEVEFDLPVGSYYPDFVFGNTVIEVKGWASDRAIEKAEQFRDEYPDYTYVVVGSKIPCDVHVSWENREEVLEVIEHG